MSTPTRYLCEYVASVRVDPKLWEHSGDGSSSMLDAPLDGVVCARFPEDGVSETPFPEMVEKFVFPTGIVLADCPSGDTGPVIHSFVLTGGDGNYIYGHCACRYVPLGERKQSLLKMQAGVRTMHSDSVDEELRLRRILSHTGFFEPDAICLLSAFPLHRTLTAVLRAFCDSLQPRERVTSVQLEALVASLRAEALPCQETLPTQLRVGRSIIPCFGFHVRCVWRQYTAPGAKARPPAVGETVPALADLLHVDRGQQNDGGQVTVERCVLCGRTRDVAANVGKDGALDAKPGLSSACQLPLPANESDFRGLVSSLSPHTVLRVFALLLAERKVLAISTTPSQLARCLEPLMALLYPLQWCHVYIPLLPSAIPLLDVLQAPMPFVLGTVRQLWEDAGGGALSGGVDCRPPGLPNDVQVAKRVGKGGLSVLFTSNFSECVRRALLDLDYDEIVVGCAETGGGSDNGGWLEEELRVPSRFKQKVLEAMAHHSERTLGQHGSGFASVMAAAIGGGDNTAEIRDRRRKNHEQLLQALEMHVAAAAASASALASSHSSRAGAAQRSKLGLGCSQSFGASANSSQGARQQMTMRTSAVLYSSSEEDVGGDGSARVGGGAWRPMSYGYERAPRQDSQALHVQELKPAASLDEEGTPSGSEHSTNGDGSAEAAEPRPLIGNQGFATSPAGVAIAPVPPSIVGERESHDRSRSNAPDESPLASTSSSSREQATKAALQAKESSDDTLLSEGQKQLDESVRRMVAFKETIAMISDVRLRVAFLDMFVSMFKAFKEFLRKDEDAVAQRKGDSASPSPQPTVTLPPATPPMVSSKDDGPELSGASEGEDGADVNADHENCRVADPVTTVGVSEELDPGAQPSVVVSSTTRAELRAHTQLSPAIRTFPSSEQPLDDNVNGAIELTSSTAAQTPVALRAADSDLSLRLIFDHAAFLAEAKSDEHRSFLSGILRTQLFCCFVESRLLLMTPEAIWRHESTSERQVAAAGMLRMFEQRARLRMQRRVSRLLVLQTLDGYNGEVYMLQTKGVKQLGLTSTTWKRRFCELQGSELRVYKYSSQLQETMHALHVVARQMRGRASRALVEKRVVLCPRARNRLLPLLTREHTIDRRKKLFAYLEERKAKDLRATIKTMPGLTRVVVPETFTIYEGSLGASLVGAVDKPKRLRSVSGRKFPTNYPFDILATDGSAGKSQTIIRFCALDSRSRREWLLLLKSRLHTSEEVNRLKNEYLRESHTEVCSFAQTWGVRQSNIERRVQLYQSHFSRLYNVKSGSFDSSPPTPRKLASTSSHANFRSPSPVHLPG